MRQTATLIPMFAMNDEMNTMEVPPFDALKGDSHPTEICGPVLTGSEHDSALSNFNTMTEQARAAVQEHLKVSISSGINSVESIDRIIVDIWNTGWNPEDGNLNLFVLHFGSLLASAMLKVPGTQPVFRSTTNANHFSVLHSKSGMEYFPFHKLTKCLTESTGESASQMLNDLINKEKNGEQTDGP